MVATPSTPTESHVQPLFADDVLARLRRLIVRSQGLSRSGLSGEHRSRRKGPSPAFADFRNYAVGDDFRRIDWRAYARLDALYVRENEITSEYDVHVLVDVSRSMDWRSRPDLPTKLRLGLQVTGALAYLSLWNFDRLSITPIGSNAPYRLGPIQGRSRIRSTLAYLERMSAVQEADLVTACNRLVHERRKPGMLIVVSDFLSEDGDRLEGAIRTAVGRGWECVLVQVVDPAEENPALIQADEPTNQATDLETGQRTPIRFDASSIEGYRARRGEWNAELQRLGEGARTRFVTLSTALPIDASFGQVLRAHGLVTR